LSNAVTDQSSIQVLVNGQDDSPSMPDWWYWSAVDAAISC